MYHNIKEGAIFVADSHFNEKRDEFLIFLESIKSNNITTTQLFLMGDMFDFLSGESKYFINKNRLVIDLINELSNSIEIIYLEGNHDYNLKKLFPKVKIYERDEQAIFMKYKDKTVSLSHGDIFVNDKFYDVYCKIIRNKIFLNIMNFIDFKNYISKKIYYTLLEKNICRKIEKFKTIVEKRVKFYNTDIIIEGHFHQGDEYTIDDKLYKNIQSLTCSKEYVVLENNQFIGVKLC